MLTRLKHKGALFIEYALALAFVVVVGAVFVSSDGLSGSVKSIFNSTNKLLADAAGTDPISAALNNFPVVSFEKTSDFDNNKNRHNVSSYNANPSADETTEIAKIQDMINKMHLDEIPPFNEGPMSWRYVGDNQNGYLYLSPKQWGNTKGVDWSLVANIGSDGSVTGYSVANVYHDEQGRAYLGSMLNNGDSNGYVGQASHRNDRDTAGQYIIKDANGYSYTKPSTKEEFSNLPQYSTLSDALAAYDYAYKNK